MVGMQITDKFFYIMKDNPRVAPIEAIDLSRVYLITDEGLIEFLKSPYSRNISRINLSQTQLTDRVLFELAFSDPPRSIT